MSEYEPHVEKDNEVVFVVLEQAEGSIEPEYTPETVSKAESIAVGTFHRTIDGKIIAKCIDGRNCRHGLEGPNSAGGTLSLLVADDLTSRRYITPGMSIAEGMSKLTEDLVDRDVPVGVHCDQNASGEASGCGANDKLEVIYDLMIRKSGDIRLLAEAILGQPIPDEIHRNIIDNAGHRLSFGDGAAVRKAVTDAAGEDASETLEGSHKEIVAVVNLVHGTTLDRDALEEEYGPDIQAFNVDAWSFEASSKVIAETDDEDVIDKIIALTYYNLATALTLCGPTMKVAVRAA